jgi:deoxyribodipyrimidine photolyase-related protein
MPASVDTLRLILGDQLNPDHSWYRQPDNRVAFVMMEIRQETDYVRHHIQKVLAFFAAMRAFADQLRRRGHRVVYLALDDPANTQRLPDNLRRLLNETGARRFEYQLPDEYRLDDQLRRFCRELDVESAATGTEHFLTDRRAMADFFAGKKQYRLESFYRQMRRQHDVLMENGKPRGGRWNFDSDNRAPFGGEMAVPEIPDFRNDVGSLRRMVDRGGVETIGRLAGESLPWPVNRAQARELLHHFIRHGLARFGTYQDAMAAGQPVLFHSRLSFALNVKLLHPREVLDAVLDAFAKDPDRFTLNQVEGFVRQVLGWREYMRGVYWAEMPDYATLNHFGHHRPLPGWYWTGATRMRCLAEAIGQSLDLAYAHHIQRLMVTGNFALLAGVDPDEVDAWYLGVYIDAVEWVEITNTRGMSQYADGGLVATKPYVSTAKYIDRMSDYCAGCPYDPGIRHGPAACPFNALFWHFYDRHRDRLAGNPRTGMMLRVWDRFSRSERQAVRRQAETFLADIEDL